MSSLLNSLKLQLPPTACRMTETGEAPALLRRDPLATLQVRIHGDPNSPTLIYLPGLHGDWTLVTTFRTAISGRVRFVEFSYPRTLEWSLDDYAAAIEEALLAHGIANGWLLGESFGSQVAWALLKRAHADAGLAGAPCGDAPAEPARLDSSKASPAEAGAPKPGFRAEGVILAGGFVRYPANWGVRLAHALSVHAPEWSQRFSFCVFAQYARQRHPRGTEARADLAEFVRRRQEPLDRLAIQHRLKLIAENDPRPVARQTRLPVYSLAGLVDPIVPLPWVRHWLKRNCPGYRGGKTILRADHNVLGTAPKAAVAQICRWIGIPPPAGH